MCKKGLYEEGHLRVWMLFALSVLVSLIFSHPAWAVDYTITDLGTLGGTYSEARGINNNGQVVGAAETVDGLRRAFLYSNSSMIDLGTLGGEMDSYAFSINNNGQVVGSARTDEEQDHAFLYSNGSMTNLGTLGGMFSYARDINNYGQVAGYAANINEEQHAFLYSNGSMIDLFPSDGNYSSAYGINNKGQVVGVVYYPEERHAFLYSNGSISYLDFGGPGEAYGINDSGKVVGMHEFPLGSWTSHAFLYSNGSTSDLGTLGGANSIAHSINNNDQVVGWSHTDDSDRHAFLYSNGSMMNLISLIPANSGWTLLEVAYDINDCGQIVGFGVINSRFHAFLMTPPSAEQLIGSLEETVNRLDLKQGITISLHGKLQAAQAALDAAHANDRTTAYNLINAFINDVSAQSGKMITLEQANKLLAETRQIKMALANPCH